MSETQALLIETPIADIPQVLKRIHAGFQKRQAWSDFEQKRHALSQLKALQRLIEENLDQVSAALKADLNKSEFESIAAECNIVLADLIEAIRDFHKWTAPQYVAKGMANMMDNCYIKPEPLGVGLIVGPWNYPFQLVMLPLVELLRLFQLVMLPLVGAIAAGNAIIIKPSELSVNTSNLVYDLIPKYLDNDFYAVVTGGADIAQCLLKERFDHIFYTGSTHVGKIVMKAAAEHLTPVTLELGGKCPVIVADDANIEVAARRIIWGKLSNAGQICIAPDYVLCSESICDRFVDSCKKAAEQFYGKDPSKSPDYARIINARHFKRITGLMESTKGTCVSEVVTDEDQGYISPALYVGVTEDDPLMKEEIFGPLLPILTVSSIDEAVQFVNVREKPLAFYVFTENSKTFHYISSRTSSGALVQNTVLMHYGVNTLPFGGVGNSGIGAYHGKHTFNTYSHMKPILRTGTKMDFLLKMVYPPHNKSKIKQFTFMQLPSSRQWSLRPYLMILLAVMIAATVKVYGLPSFMYKFF